MFGVLIVDDEEPVLDSYEFLLDSFSEGEGMKSPFALAGKARTGYEALRLIHETKPALVFMDINIPGMDGLEVLEDVYKKYPRMVCILSTAYERFDLARRAIPLGVFAYLVKPVSKKTFFTTLENVLVHLRSLPEKNQELSEPASALFRRDIWAEMDEQSWNWYREKLSIPSDYGMVMIVELEQDQELLGSKIAERLSYKYHCTFGVMLNRVIFLVSEDISPAAFRQKAVKILEEQLAAVVWNYGLGGIYRGPLLYRSCDEAVTEINANRNKTQIWNRVSEKITLLRQKIGILPQEEIKVMFAGVWEPLFSEDFYSAKLRMVSLFTLFLDDLYGCWSPSRFTRRNAGGPSAILPFDPVEIMELEDLDAWKLWAERNMDKLCGKASLERQGNYPQPLLKALAFIGENYTKSIRLDDAAAAALVNNAHLSRLFTEHMKINFIDYLTTLRINEAERLLKETSITVKEAAFAVGYQDPNYFSKLFKKTKGILPTEVISSKQ